ncbi:MAG: hypothetical protein JW808_07610 [Victivallales bacterium]|nr:hypothetical protein [Victivallales bacterium]
MNIPAKQHMKTMRHRPSNARYTLIELLMAISMLSFMLTTIMLFFGKATTLCKQLSTRAYANQQILVLRNKWRKTLHSQDIPELSTADQGMSFVSGPRSVEVKDRHIHFKTPQATESYRLPNSANVRFEIEDHPLQKIAVMIVELDNPAGKKDTVRIVACQRQNHEK